LLLHTRLSRGNPQGRCLGYLKSNHHYCSPASEIILIRFHLFCNISPRCCRTPQPWRRPRFTRSLIRTHTHSIVHTPFRTITHAYALRPCESVLRVQSMPVVISDLASGRKDARNGGSEKACANNEGRIAIPIRVISLLCPGLPGHAFPHPPIPYARVHPKR
jgi:hypothetical protein